MDRPLGPWAPARRRLRARAALLLRAAPLPDPRGRDRARLARARARPPSLHRFLVEGGLAYSLPAVYALWVGVVLALYPACRWFADVKRRSRARVGELPVRAAVVAAGLRRRCCRPAAAPAACRRTRRRSAADRRCARASTAAAERIAAASDAHVRRRLGAPDRARRRLRAPDHGLARRSSRRSPGRRRACATTVSTTSASSRCACRTGCAAPSARASSGPSIGRMALLGLGGTRRARTARCARRWSSFESLDELRASPGAARRHDRLRQPSPAAVRRGARRPRATPGRAGAAARRLRGRQARRRRRARAVGDGGEPAHAAHRGAQLRRRRAQDPRRGGLDRGRRPAGHAWRAAGRSRSTLSLGARTLPDAPSANVVGELRGRERPDEIVLLGAHIDSWDVGQGASDDGAGCVAVMEALRLLRQTGLVPRRTIRAVLFTGEEYGLAGAAAYRAPPRSRAPRRGVRDGLRHGRPGCHRRRQRRARARDGAAPAGVRPLRHPSLSAARLRRRRAADRRDRCGRRSISSPTATTTSTSTTPRPTRSTRSAPTTCAGTPRRSRCWRACSPNEASLPAPNGLTPTACRR